MLKRKVNKIKAKKKMKVSIKHRDRQISKNIIKKKNKINLSKTIKFYIKNKKK